MNLKPYMITIIKPLPMDAQLKISLLEEDDKYRVEDIITQNGKVLHLNNKLFTDYEEAREYLMSGLEI